MNSFSGMAEQRFALRLSDSLNKNGYQPTLDH
jgi:hypothetical protein